MAGAVAVLYKPLGAAHCIFSGKLCFVSALNTNILTLDLMDFPVNVKPSVKPRPVADRFNSTGGLPGLLCRQLFLCRSQLSLGLLHAELGFFHPIAIPRAFLSAFGVPALEVAPLLTLPVSCGGELLASALPPDFLPVPSLRRRSGGRACSWLGRNLLSTDFWTFCLSGLTYLANSRKTCYTYPNIANGVRECTVWQD